MGSVDADTERSWIDGAARLSWWVYALAALLAFVLIGRLAPQLETSAGGRTLSMVTMLLAVLRIVTSLLLLFVGAASTWGRMRQTALCEVRVSEPSEAEFRAACAAGRDLAARGKLGLVLAGGGAKGAYQVGCWRALRACGVMQFGAIAGTSVGALNAVLVAQDDYDKAESIWHNMSFSRVLRLRWHVVLAVLIRALLIVPYMGKLIFPARAIPVAMWRAVNGYRKGAREGDPLMQFAAGLKLYSAFLSRPDGADILSNVVLAAVVLAGLSAWWMLAVPVLVLLATFTVAPLLAFLLTAYASWFVIMLDQLSTRLVLATNEPLHQLLIDCVDVTRLRTSTQPLFVTLASLREVTRMAAPKNAPINTQSSQIHPLKTDAEIAPSWWEKNVVGDPDQADFVLPSGGLEPSPVTTIEYVPSHFDLRAADPSTVHELILQSAGLPEIFPARRIGNDTYVDGGIVDNVPLAALANVPNQAAIIVIPLDAELDEVSVRNDLSANLERLGRSMPDSLPELIMLPPSRPLGNFLTGTLDFGALRARALMQLGYCDTVRRLAQRSNEKHGYAGGQSTLCSANSSACVWQLPLQPQVENFSSV